MVSPLKTDLAGPRIDKGLDDVYVKETSICFIDGQRGRLLYRGYDIRDLAAHSTFEETVFLLLEGHLPNREELEKAKADLATARTLPPSVLRLLRSMPEHAPPMDVAMILYADHAMNASTFAATVAASTLADLYSTITAALDRVLGRLHGGAIEASLNTIERIGHPKAAEEFVLNTLRNKEKVYGFGHRVYKTYDPRALILKDFARRLAEMRGDDTYYRIATAIEDTVVRQLASKQIFPNVDFYAGLVFHGLGIPTDLFTTVFAIARIAGWTAQVIEYWEDNRLLRPLAWYPVPAGERAMFQYGDMLPEATLGTIKEYVVGLKGPLTTPVSGGFRSLNVTLRKALDLYANVRPVSWIPGVPSPVTHPERLDIVIFREGTEDVYTGIEWEKGTAEAQRMIEILDTEFHAKVRADSGIGVKPISETGSKRLGRKASRDAMGNRRKSVTLVHKGNNMKVTEGAFRTWGYEVAKIEFRESTIPWDDVVKSHGGKIPDGKIVIKDVIADNMFQQLLLRPEEYDVLATTNLNGDYLSDAAAAQIGGLGVAAGGNIGDAHALFEPVHGSAPKYAGMDKVNPTAEMLAGVMMLEYLGWREAAGRLRSAVKSVVGSKVVTYDLARLMPGAKEVRTSAFARAVVDAMDGAGR